jgi:hypothetical protein
MISIFMEYKTESNGPFYYSFIFMDIMANINVIQTVCDCEEHI